MLFYEVCFILLYRQRVSIPMPEEISPYLTIAQLIEKLLTGGLSFAEQKHLDNWLAESEDNCNLLKSLYKTIAQNRPSECWSKTDPGLAWKRFAGKHLVKKDTPAP